MWIFILSFMSHKECATVDACEKALRMTVRLCFSKRLHWRRILPPAVLGVRCSLALGCSLGLAAGCWSMSNVHLPCLRSTHMGESWWHILPHRIGTKPVSTERKIPCCHLLSPFSQQISFWWVFRNKHLEYSLHICFFYFKNIWYCSLSG